MGMPLHWLIDSKARLLVITAEGDVTHADAQDCLASVVGAHAMPYRKLFDGTHGNIAMRPDELLSLGVTFRGFHELPLGALALVLSDDQREQIARLLGVLAAAGRPIRLFERRLQARRWLDAFLTNKPSANVHAGK